MNQVLTSNTAWPEKKERKERKKSKRENRYTKSKTNDNSKIMLTERNKEVSHKIKQGNKEKNLKMRTTCKDKLTTTTTIKM